jgi:hypothetical protein
MGYAPSEVLDVEVMSDRASEKVVVELRPGATVEGTVMDDRTGEAIVGARVTLVAVDDDEAIPVGRTKTGPEGHFTLFGLPPGIFVAVAHMPGFAEGESEAFELEPGMNRAAVRIFLRRIDEEDGEEDEEGAEEDEP